MIYFALERFTREVYGNGYATIYSVAFQKEYKEFFSLKEAVSFATTKINSFKDRHIKELKDIYYKGIFAAEELQRSIELHRLIGECIALELRLEITKDKLAAKEKSDKEKMEKLCNKYS